MKHDKAKELFMAVWRLYVKYEGGSAGDGDVFWHNLVTDSAELTAKWPYPFAKDLVEAVLRELSSKDSDPETRPKDFSCEPH